MAKLDQLVGGESSQPKVQLWRLKGATVQGFAAAVCRIAG